MKHKEYLDKKQKILKLKSEIRHLESETETYIKEVIKEYFPITLYDFPTCEVFKTEDNKFSIQKWNNYWTIYELKENGDPVNENGLYRIYDKDITNEKDFRDALTFYKFLTKEKDND